MDVEFLFLRPPKTNFSRESCTCIGIAKEWYSSNYFQNGTFACRLISYDSNTWKFDSFKLGILNFVDQVEQSLLLTGNVLASESITDRNWCFVSAAKSVEKIQIGENVYLAVITKERLV